MKAVIRWNGLMKKELDFLRRERCLLCREISKKYGNFVNLLNKNSLNDEAFLSMLSQDLGVASQEARRYAAFCGLNYAVLKSWDILIDDDEKFVYKLIAKKILRSYQPHFIGNYNHRIFSNAFQSFEEWIMAVSYPYEKMFENAVPDANEPMAEVGRCIGALSALRDAWKDSNKEKINIFNPFRAFDKRKLYEEIRKFFKHRYEDLSKAVEEITLRGRKYKGITAKLLANLKNDIKTVSLFPYPQATFMGNQITITPEEAICCLLIILAAFCAGHCCGSECK
jgi:hypothetical protein